MKALVEATPIFGPAWVSRVRSDSRTSELRQRCRSPRWRGKPSSLALRAGSQGVGGLTGLGDGDEQAIGCTATLR